MIYDLKYSDSVLNFINKNNLQILSNRYNAKSVKYLFLLALNYNFSTNKINEINFLLIYLKIKSKHINF